MNSVPASSRLRAPASMYGLSAAGGGNRDLVKVPRPFVVRQEPEKDEMEDAALDLKFRQIGQLPVVPLLKCHVRPEGQRL